MMPENRFWTVPNVLSLFRIILIIPIIDRLKENTPDAYLTAFILIAIAYFTDFLDGFIARTFKTVSKVGQILDPIGDKLLAITVSAVLYFGKQVPLYFFILILVRDLIISLGAMYAMNTRKMIMLPLISGKITTFLLGFVLAFYPLSCTGIMQIAPWSAIIKTIVVYGTYVSSFFLVLSGLLYTINYFQNFLLQKKEKA